MLALLLLPAGIQRAEAYGNIYTHPLITERANTLLQSGTTGYFEAKQYLQLMRQGATDEDSPDTIVVNHFYNPATGQKLTVSGLGLFNVDALTRAKEKWVAAIQRYKSGPASRGAAYREMGHILHLLGQDLAQPAHVHNDPHLPAVLLGDSSPFEDFVEGIATNSPTQFPGGNVVVRGTLDEQDPDGSLVVSSFGKPLAELTYKASRFLGELNENPVGGVVDVGTKRHFAVLILLDPDELDFCLAEPHWEIPGVDYPMCYDPASEGNYDRGASYDNDWWIVTDRLPGDSFSPSTKVFYFDQPDQVLYGTGSGNITLNHRFFNELLPKAAEYTAGLIRLFGRTVDPVPPTITLRNGDQNGPVIEEGGAAGEDLYFEVLDPGPGDPGGSGQYPVPSWVYKIELKNLDTNTVVPISPPISTTGEALVTRTVQGLSEGPYRLTAFDGTGNEASVTFDIDLCTFLFEA